MNRRTKIGASIAAGATAVLAVTAIAVASPSTSAQADDATPNPTSTATADNGHTPETPLTGSDAEKATAAAKEAVPGGTIIRVETDSDGEASYEAHVRKTDGTEVARPDGRQLQRHLHGGVHRARWPRWAVAGAARTRRR